MYQNSQSPLFFILLLFPICCDRDLQSYVYLQTECHLDVYFSGELPFLTATTTRRHPYAGKRRMRKQSYLDLLSFWENPYALMRLLVFAGS